MRSRLSVRDLSPLQMRTLLRRTADDLGMLGFDFVNGYGMIDTSAIVEAIRRRRKNGGR